MINKNFNIDKTLYNILFNHVFLLQQKYSKLEALRMDFYYIKDSELQTERNQSLNVEDMETLTKKLMEEKLIVAYQWVPEYSEDSGLHYHVAFYVDLNKFLNSYTVFKRATTLWEEITNNHGRVNYCKPKFYREKLGKLLYYSSNGYKKLLFVISYFAKTDQKIKYPNGQYVIFTSDVPKPSTRGRKRSKVIANLHQFYPFTQPQS